MRPVDAVVSVLLCAIAARAQDAPSAQHAGPGESAWQRVLAAPAGWQQAHPDLCSTLTLGRSVEDRPLVLVRIGSQQDNAPEILLGGGIHGHEHSEEDALWLVEHLLAQRGDPHVAGLLATRVLWVQLAVNPDGIVARSRKNARGVDLNRNFDVHWQAGMDPGARDYPGPEPFSEPETRAVRDFLLDRPQLRAYLDLHRSVRLLVAAARRDGTAPPKIAAASAALAKVMGDHPRLARTASSRFHGLAVDWAGEELGVVAFTLESPRSPSGPVASDPRWVLLHWLLEQAPTLPPSRCAESTTFAPQEIAAATRSNPRELALLQTPGTVLFADDFESEASLGGYFELSGAAEGRVALAQDAALAHAGHGALMLLSADRGGRSGGAHAARWLGDEGHDVVHLRYWIRYAADYDQGNLNHTGGSLSAVSGSDKWGGMGTAGLRPLGDDRFDSRVEGWVGWRRAPPPGWLMCYVYWMDMQRDRDGHFWGNLLGPAAEQRRVPPRDRWLCVEQRLAANKPGEADGELAVWLDGELYLHHRGIRWRSSDVVKIKRATLMVYVHAATRDNRVYFDDVVVSTGYVGPGAAAAPK